MLPEFSKEINIIEQGNCIWIIPCNEISVYTANLLSKNINESIGTTSSLPVIFDLTKVTYLDSAALGVIVGIIKLYNEKNVDLFFYNPDEFAISLFKQTGLDQLAKICYKLNEIPEKYRLKI